MKKSLIAAAGVSAFAAVAMPVAGVFAAGEVMNIKDTLQVTVSSSCTLADVTPAAASTDTGNAYTGSGAPNELVTLAADTATSFKVTCNDEDGYTITPTFSALHISTSGAGTDQDIAYSGTDAAEGSKTWTAYYALNSGTATAFSASGASGAIEGESTMTDTYALSYKVGLGANQAAGTYNGTATYVLAAK